MAEHARVAEVAYSKDLNRIEVVLPNGTRLGDFAKISDVVFGRDIMGRLPRGCQTCTSGDHLMIRERLEHVIRVDLEKRTIIGP
jgi:hypothetical protein